MPTFTDPAFLPPIPFITESRTFTDPTAPGEEWPLVFEVQEGVPSRAFVPEEARRWYQRYGGPEGEPIYGPRNNRIPISEELCTHIATLLMMDRTDYGVNDKGASLRFGFRHWVQLSPRPVFRQIMEWAYDLRLRAIQAAGGDAEDDGIDLKNESAAPEAESSVGP